MTAARKQRKPPAKPRKPKPESPADTPGAEPPLSVTQERRVEAHRERVTADRERRGMPLVAVKKTESSVVISPPPDRNHLAWQTDFTRAFGTDEHPVANLLFNQLINATSPDGQPNEGRYNGMIAMMTVLEPRDEIEGMLIAQMVATHDAAMDLLRQMRRTGQRQQFEGAGSMATKMLRTYTAQLEALKRYRSKGEQKVTVQHVHVTAEQAAVQVNGHTPGGGGATEIHAAQPLANGVDLAAIAHSPVPALRSPDASGNGVLLSCSEGQAAVPDARRR